jgi:nucleoside-diphosphate kinase
MLAEEHYAEHRGKVFFASLIEYIRGNIHYPDAPEKRRVIALVYRGPGAVQKIRDFAGPTNPHVARERKPGCIRALGTVVPIKDAAGNVIGERMDNLIHASATADEAEREIKLWFRPVDIPPLMRAYPTEICEELFYFKGNRLYVIHEPESVCLLAPGDIVWKSDLEALHALRLGMTSCCSLQTVAAKYLINENRE